EAQAMVMPAADTDGVLFDDAQTGMSLAGVDNLRARARDRIDERSRRRRDSREQLDEVERRALADQQSRKLALDFRENSTRFQLGAFGRKRNHSRLSARLPHHGFN